MAGGWFTGQACPLRSTPVRVEGGRPGRPSPDARRGTASPSPAAPGDRGGSLKVKGSARIISIIERVVKSLAGIQSCDRWIVPAAGTIAPVAARALGATACPSAAAASSSRFGEDVADGKVQSRRVEPERPLARDPRLDDLARAAVVNDRAQDQVDDEVMLDAGTAK